MERQDLGLAGRAGIRRRADEGSVEQHPFTHAERHVEVGVAVAGAAGYAAANAFLT